MKKPIDGDVTPAPNLLDTLLHGGRPFNPSVDLSPYLYCPFIENLPTGCMSENLLELWKYDESRMRALTKDDILSTLNRTTVSPVTGHDTDYVHLLGGIRRNSSGHIVGASSLLTHWMLFVNFSQVDHTKIGNAAGTEDWVFYKMTCHFALRKS